MLLLLPLDDDDDDDDDDDQRIIVAAELAAVVVRCGGTVQDGTTKGALILPVGYLVVVMIGCWTCTTTSNE